MRVLKRNVTEAVSGSADKWVADNIYLVATNNWPYARDIENLAHSLVKKEKRGVAIDMDKLINSSVLDSMVRNVIRELKKEDDEGDQEGYFNYISTATRKLAKQAIAERILDKVEDIKRYSE